MKCEQCKKNKATMTSQTEGNPNSKQNICNKCFLATKIVVHNSNKYNINFLKKDGKNFKQLICSESEILNIIKQINSGSRFLLINYENPLETIQEHTVLININEIEVIDIYLTKEKENK